MTRSTSNLLCFVAGAAVGTALGILYAPDKGSNTRDKLTYRLDKYKEKLQELTAELMKGKDITSNAAKSEGERVIIDAKIKAEKLLDDVEDLIGQIKGKS